jgi:hypothetical protein
MPKQTNYYIRKLLVIFFTFVALLYICGCTAKALKFAETKGTDTYNLMAIQNVRTATKQENGDISICVDFANLSDLKKPESYTIVLPISSFAKDHADKNAHDFEYISEATDIFSIYKFDWYPSNWKFYRYPIGKAQKGCDKISSAKLSKTESPFPIEKIKVTLTNSFEIDNYKEAVKIRSQEDRIYEVTVVNDVTRKIHLIYWPSQRRQEQEGIVPIGIASGYQFNKGSNWGYLLVPPAAFVDLILLGLSSGACCP